MELQNKINDLKKELKNKEIEKVCHLEKIKKDYEKKIINYVNENRYFQEKKSSELNNTTNFNSVYENKSKICLNKSIENKNDNYEECYDVVIEGESFYKPWIIKKNKNSQIDFNNIPKLPLITIIGNFDKGKSFLLSELANKKFPSGYDKNTPWICMHYPKNNEKKGEFLNAIVIDSAGFETPLDFHLNNNEVIIKFIFLSIFTFIGGKFFIQILIIFNNKLQKKFIYN